MSDMPSVDPTERHWPRTFADRVECHVTASSWAGIRSDRINILHRNGFTPEVSIRAIMPAGLRSACRLRFGATGMSRWQFRPATTPEVEWGLPPAKGLIS
jgi:hypothetical protein